MANRALILTLAIKRYTPWWIMSALWRCGLVDRTTVLRWEMDVALGGDN